MLHILVSCYILALLIKKIDITEVLLLLSQVFEYITVFAENSKTADSFGMQVTKQSEGRRVRRTDIKFNFPSTSDHSFPLKIVRQLL